MRPLEGIRVITLESFGAAPYGTMLLADLGADVIKVENPETGGDTSRGVGPHLLGEHDSQYFQSFNMNKGSVTLDLTETEDRKAFEDLVVTADAVVNNLRGDIPEKLGIDYARLGKLNPAIVCLHISAYGRDNGRKGWPGYDFLAQAESGLMSVTGEPDGPPCRLGVSIIDYMTGTTGVVGLLACLMRAKATGIGCDVDTSLFEVAAHQHAYSATWYLNSGEIPTRQPRGSHQSMVPVQTVRTGDGWIYVMCMKAKFWEILAERIERPDLITDPRFSTAAARLANRSDLTRELDAAMGARTSREWLDIFAGAIPAAPIYTVDEAFANPFMTEIGMVTSIEHPQGDLKVLAPPLKVDGKRPGKSAAPALGSGNARYLADRTSRSRSVA